MGLADGQGHVHNVAVDGSRAAAESAGSVNSSRLAALVGGGGDPGLADLSSGSVRPRAHSGGGHGDEQDGFAGCPALTD